MFSSPDVKPSSRSPKIVTEMRAAVQTRAQRIYPIVCRSPLILILSYIIFSIDTGGSIVLPLRSSSKIERLSSRIRWNSRWSSRNLVVVVEISLLVLVSVTLLKKW
ncbi:hypothetical protein KY290_003601 [Solanum tuberosum]|uniref:Uncharacterized protein n=1 Tax=Solanum tuberosum TaxID=4113 RepID=A0ABQ7WVD8_SOLTU|nr:hypothetical protein KY284_003753 [Solanum tuberosum]KAH0732752.1 hypothetical protein KY289_003940 [Solanum tuberosum]KAH0767730.1 hypothetical protein KY285_003601 [Solanum tuberosum]KAH0784003.1 hypothetical protein KY290_003601 [Solanum tuberosum]